MDKHMRTQLDRHLTTPPDDGDDDDFDAEHAAGWDAAERGESLNRQKSPEWNEGWFDYCIAQCKKVTT